MDFKCRKEKEGNMGFDNLILQEALEQIVSSL